ncbi:TatD family hydrolase [Corynebacterium sp. H130]|uniref:TatD family hydrolase n=1 Tax=Corynebacterium sp. H130 TaxID=3133444 RepID=UPI00309B574A
MLLDTHYHLDFLSSPSEFVKLAPPVIAQTVLPSSFKPGPWQSLGYHPWWVGADFKHELALFDEHLPSTRLIGEIGMDFSPKRIGNSDLQERVFTHIVGALDSSHVMSIHAVKSVSAVLDLLTDCPATPIIHWFSGNSDELTRLMRIGGFISVNPRMLESKRGRAFVKQVPENRILLETDLPTSDELTMAEQAELASRTLHCTVEKLSALRGYDMLAAIEANQLHLYGPRAGEH